MYLQQNLLATLKRLNRFEIRNILYDLIQKSYDTIPRGKKLTESKPFCFLSVFSLSMENVQSFVTQDFRVFLYKTVTKIWKKIAKYKAVVDNAGAFGAILTNLPDVWLFELFSVELWQ